MQKTPYSREGNTIFYKEEGFVSSTKVAVINKAGFLQPSKGQGHHLEPIKAFLAEIGDEIEVEAAAEGGFIATSKAHPGANGQGETKEEAVASFWDAVELLKQDAADTPKSAISNRQSSIIPPCPPEDPAAGDKTPAVIAWWHRYHPEEAAARYKGRRFTMPEGL